MGFKVSISRESKKHLLYTLENFPILSSIIVVLSAYKLVESMQVEDGGLQAIFFSAVFITSSISAISILILTQIRYELTGMKESINKNYIVLNQIRNKLLEEK